MRVGLDLTLCKLCKRVRGCANARKGKEKARWKLYVHFLGVFLSPLWRFATYLTLFWELQKPTNTHIRRTDAMDTHLTRCLIHPSLRTYPKPPPPGTGRYLLPGLMYALVSDHEKYVSDFTLSSLGLVHGPPSIIAATSPIPWGGIKWNEYKILPGAFYMHRNAWLMCCSGMARVRGTLLFHCYSLLPKQWQGCVLLIFQPSDCICDRTFY